MPLTKSECLDQFLAAWSALDAVSLSPKSTPDQVRAAESAQDQLTHDFIRERLDNLSERNAAFARFATMMQETVEAIGNRGPLAAIKRLRDVTDGAAQELAKMTPKPASTANEG